jgi:hypothetical protein
LEPPRATGISSRTGWTFPDTERMLLQAGFDPDAVLSRRANCLGLLLLGSLQKAKLDGGAVACRCAVGATPEATPPIGSEAWA